jgi:putative FmdB family regulatory protein
MLLAMPLYDFRCKSCDHEFEALVRTGDVPLCPACKGQDLERLLSTFAVDSAERRQAAAKDSRRRQIAGRRDAVIAEEEYRQKHDKE